MVAWHCCKQAAESTVPQQTCMSMQLEHKHWRPPAAEHGEQQAERKDNRTPHSAVPAVCGGSESDASLDLQQLEEQFADITASLNCPADVRPAQV